MRPGHGRKIFQLIALAGPFCAPIRVDLCRVAGTGTRGPWCGASVGRRDAARMTSIDRYIFRTTFGAFALILISLTAFIWITQALREIDLMTNQGPDHPGLHRHDRPAHSGPGADHRADRPDDRGDLRAQQVQRRFGIHHHERGRDVVLARVRAVLRGCGRGFPPGGRDQRLCRAQGPARAAQLGRQGARRPRHHHHAARALHHHRTGPHLPHPGAPKQRTAHGHLHRRPARPPRSAPRFWPNAGRSWRARAAPICS